jgi:hypothetical protein
MRVLIKFGIGAHTDLSNGLISYPQGPVTADVLSKVKIEAF